MPAQELLSQCGHYSDKVRRRAVAGLADLLARHPQELPQHASRVVHAAALLLGDPEAAVRAALLDLAANTILPGLSAAALAPFLPLLMAHVSGALTHIVLAVRTDALRFLELLTQRAPALVVAGHCDAVLRHFCDALSQVRRSQLAGTRLVSLRRNDGLRLTQLRAGPALAHNEGTLDGAPRQHAAQAQLLPSRGVARVSLSACHC